MERRLLLLLLLQYAKLQTSARVAEAMEDKAGQTGAAMGKKEPKLS